VTLSCYNLRTLAHPVRTWVPIIRTASEGRAGEPGHIFDDGAFRFSPGARSARWIHPGRSDAPSLVEHGVLR
jgi:hypothetical protein